MRRGQQLKDHREAILQERGRHYRGHPGISLAANR
jgi:hypothetical protein